MEVKQIYEIVNNATEEVLGESGLLQQDLGNIVDVGTSVFNQNAIDHYVKSLVNHIGKVIFVNRQYAGGVPSLMMNSWEFGSVLEKISADLPDATENESWELNNLESYDPNVFYKPSVSAKFFNKRVTFEIPMSFTERQVKESFSSAAQLNGFISMLYNAVEKSMTVKLDALIMRTLDNFIAETMYTEYNSGTSFSGGSHVKAVNLLYLYNQTVDPDITAADALTNPDFLRFAACEMNKYVYRMGKISTLFNIGGKDRFTPSDMLHCVLLADFEAATNSYLQSDTFHNQMVALPKHETVPYWQGSGTGYAFSDTGKVYCKTADNHDVTATGILGVMFDRDAIGVCNMDRRVTSNYNPKGEFYNNWFKMDAGYFIDKNESFVVFFVA